jgi:hypothetical protein
VLHWHSSVEDCKPTRKKDKDISDALGYNRFVLGTVWTIGTDRLSRDDAKEQYAALNRRFDRKHNTTRALHKLQTESTSTCKFKD